MVEIEAGNWEEANTGGALVLIRGANETICYNNPTLTGSVKMLVKAPNLSETGQIPHSGDFVIHEVDLIADTILAGKWVGVIPSTVTSQGVERLWVIFCDATGASVDYGWMLLKRDGKTNAAGRGACGSLGIPNNVKFHVLDNVAYMSVYDELGNVVFTSPLNSLGTSTGGGGSFVFHYQLLASLFDATAVSIDLSLFGVPDTATRLYLQAYVYTDSDPAYYSIEVKASNGVWNTKAASRQGQKVYNDFHFDRVAAALLEVRRGYSGGVTTHSFETVRLYLLGYEN